MAQDVYSHIPSSVSFMENYDVILKNEKLGYNIIDNTIVINNMSDIDFTINDEIYGICYSLGYIKISNDKIQIINNNILENGCIINILDMTSYNYEYFKAILNNNDIINVKINNKIYNTYIYKGYFNSSNLSLYVPNIKNINDINNIALEIECIHKYKYVKLEIRDKISIDGNQCNYICNISNDIELQKINDFENIITYKVNIKKFHRLNKDNVYSLHHGAIQYLDTQNQLLQKTIDELKQENKVIQDEVRNDMNNIKIKLGI